MNTPENKSNTKPAKEDATKRAPSPPRNDRPTVGEADGGSGTPDDHRTTRSTDKGMRGLDKSGGTRGGGR